ncbi:MAG: hypothetical protein ACRD5H_00700 [Nitrososphaerales archaeon]
MEVENNKGEEEVKEEKKIAIVIPTAATTAIAAITARFFERKVFIKIMTVRYINIAVYICKIISVGTLLFRSTPVIRVIMLIAVKSEPNGNSVATIPAPNIAAKTLPPQHAKNESNPDIIPPPVIAMDVTASLLLL